MGKKAPDAPDLGPMADVSLESAKIAQQTAREQLDWSKTQDTANRALLERVLTGQQAVQDETLANAREDRQRYEQVYQPLEDNLVKEFQNYDSPERREQERGRAMADVSASFDAQRRNALQRLESYGVDPSQTRNAALDIGVRTQQAAAMAGAGTASNRATEQTGRALRAEAINIGKGLPSNVAASYGQSLQAGNSQVGNANQTTSTSGNAMQGANSFLNTSISGAGQAGNTMTQGYQNQMAQYNANQASTTGMLSAVGGIAGMFMADGGKTRKALPIADDGSFESQPGAIDYGEGDGSGIDDQVPIQASKGEYIIPADVVRIKGEEFFDRLVEKYHTPADQQDDQQTQDIASGKQITPQKKAMGGPVLQQRMGGMMQGMAQRIQQRPPMSGAPARMQQTPLRNMGIPTIPTGAQMPAMAGALNNLRGAPMGGAPMRQPQPVMGGRMAIPTMPGRQYAA